MSEYAEHKNALVKGGGIILVCLLLCSSSFLDNADWMLLIGFVRYIWKFIKPLPIILNQLFKKT